MLLGQWTGDKLSGPKLDSAFKNLLRQISLGGIGDQSNNPLPFPKALGDLDRRVNSVPGARPSKHAFARRQFFNHAEGLIIGHHHHFVANGSVEISGNKSVTNAFHFMRTRLASAQNRALRFHRHSMNFRKSLLQKTSDSSERSRRATANRNGIDASIHLLKNLAGRSLVVIIGVG